MFNMMAALDILDAVAWVGVGWRIRIVVACVFAKERAHQRRIVLIEQRHDGAIGVCGGAAARLRQNYLSSVADDVQASTSQFLGTIFVNWCAPQPVKTHAYVHGLAPDRRPYHGRQGK